MKLKSLKDIDLLYKITSQLGAVGLEVTDVVLTKSRYRSYDNHKIMVNAQHTRRNERLIHLMLKGQKFGYNIVWAIPMSEEEKSAIKQEEEAQLRKRVTPLHWSYGNEETSIFRRMLTRMKMDTVYPIWSTYTQSPPF